MLTSFWECERNNWNWHWQYISHEHYLVCCLAVMRCDNVAEKILLIVIVYWFLDFCRTLQCFLVNGAQSAHFLNARDAKKFGPMNSSCTRAHSPVWPDWVANIKVKDNVPLVGLDTCCLRNESLTKSKRYLYCHRHPNSPSQYFIKILKN